jgi:coenzyme F420-reducing hydrogenase alpha subunit
MKKIILPLSFMMLATFAWSQGPGGGGQRPERHSSAQMIKQATKELSLTDEQVEQWTDIHEKYESSMDDRAKAEATMKKMGQELEATLAKEQLEKFKKMRKNQGRPPRKN